MRVTILDGSERTVRAGSGDNGAADGGEVMDAHIITALDRVGVQESVGQVYRE